MKHSAPSHSAPKAHHEPVKHEPAKAKHEPAPKAQETPKQQAPKQVEKDDPNARPSAYSEQSRPERDRIAESVDRLIATIKAELDSDRLQGTARNQLTETIERLQQQRNQLSTVPGA